MLVENYLINSPNSESCKLVGCGVNWKSPVALLSGSAI